MCWERYETLESVDEEREELEPVAEEEPAALEEEERELVTA